MVIDFGVKSQFWHCKITFEASVQHVQNCSSTQLIEVTSCIEKLDCTIQAEDLSHFSCHQMLTMDKNWQSYTSPMKLIRKLMVMSIHSS
jgi:hypothetical protein